MESDDPLHPAYNKVIVAKRNLEDVNHRLSLLVDTQEARVEGYNDAKNGLGKAIVEHPELSPIEKMAWLFALKQSTHDPYNLESLATDLTWRLQRLVILLSEEDTPIVEVNLGIDSSLDVYSTAGEASLDEGFARFNFGAYNEHGLERSESISDCNLEGFATSNEEVDETRPELLLKPAGERTKGKKVLIVGAAAITRLGERLINPQLQADSFYLQVLVRKTMALGIDLEQKSDLIREEMHKHREKWAKICAQSIHNQIMIGYWSPYEAIAKESQELGLPPALVIGELSKLLETPGAEYIKELQEKARASETPQLED